jgi:outer membrane biosynthesis protein TonB
MAMRETTTTEPTDASDNDLAAAMGIEPATPPVEPIDPPDETPAARRKRKKREAYAAKKAVDEKPPEPTPEPPEQTAKQPERPTARRLTAGSKCPKCDRGLIGVLRTRLQRSKNKRTRILGCRNLGCLWDLDGDNVRENPINQGKPITD